MLVSILFVAFVISGAHNLPNSIRQSDFYNNDETANSRNPKETYSFSPKADFQNSYELNKRDATNYDSSQEEKRRSAHTEADFLSLDQYRDNRQANLNPKEHYHPKLSIDPLVGYTAKDQASFGITGERDFSQESSASVPIITESNENEQIVKESEKNFNAVKRSPDSYSGAIRIPISPSSKISNNPSASGNVYTVHLQTSTSSPIQNRSDSESKEYDVWDEDEISAQEPATLAPEMELWLRQQNTTSQQDDIPTDYDHLIIRIDRTPGIIHTKTEIKPNSNSGALKIINNFLNSQNSREKPSISIIGLKHANINASKPLSDAKRVQTRIGTNRNTSETQTSEIKTTPTNIIIRVVSESEEPQKGTQLRKPSLERSGRHSKKNEKDFKEPNPDSDDVTVPTTKIEFIAPMVESFIKTAEPLKASQQHVEKIGKFNSEEPIDYSQDYKELEKNEEAQTDEEEVEATVIVRGTSKPTTGMTMQLTTLKPKMDINEAFAAVHVAGDQTKSSSSKAVVPMFQIEQLSSNNNIIRIQKSNNDSVALTKPPTLIEEISEIIKQINLVSELINRTTEEEKSERKDMIKISDNVTKEINVDAKDETIQSANLVNDSGFRQPTKIDIHLQIGNPSSLKGSKINSNRISDTDAYGYASIKSDSHHNRQRHPR